jgi:hypothetical protein
MPRSAAFIFSIGEKFRLETIQKQWERRKVVTIRGQSPALLCPLVFHKDGKPIKPSAMLGMRRVNQPDLQPRYSMTSGARLYGTWFGLAFMNEWP